MTQYTLNNVEYKNIIDKHVIERFVPEVKKLELEDKKSGNIFQNSINNSIENLDNERKYAQNIGINLIQKNILKETFYGTLGLLLRIPVVWSLYSLLFFIFGNTQGQLDQKALNNITGLRSIGIEVIKNLNLYIAPNKISELEKKFKYLKLEDRIYDYKFQKSILELIKK